MAAVDNLNVAITMLAQGFDDAYTAASLQVPPDTIRNIRKNYAADIQREKDALPLKGFVPLPSIQTHRPSVPILRVYQTHQYTGLTRCVYGDARYVEVLIDEPNHRVAIRATENAEGTWPVGKGTISRVALARELRRLAGCQKGHWLGHKVGDAYVFDLKEGADA